MRLFAAVQPPPEVLAHLENALAMVRDTAGAGAAAVGGRGHQAGGLRWTAPEDRHVTVAFFGEVPQGYLDDVASGLDALGATHVAFDATLRGAGLFDARTLWVGCAGEGWAPLMSDACRLGTELLGRAEDRRSRPHLTVARARAGRASGTDPAALAHALALYAGPTWTVGEIALVSSQLGAGPGGGPRHDVVHRSALAAVAG